MLILQLAIGLALTACIIAVCLILSNLLRSSDFLASWLFGVKPKKTAAQPAAESAPVIDISELPHDRGNACDHGKMTVPLF